MTTCSLPPETERVTPLLFASMKPVINVAILAAAAAVAVFLVASRRERRPAPQAGTWEPADRTNG